MATGNFIVAEIKEHIEIPNADKIVSSVVYGEALILGKEENPIGTKGIIIDSESKIHPEVLSRLNMYRHSEHNEDKSKQGYINDDGRVRQIRLKGVKCTALFLSFKQLEPVLGEINLTTGTQSNEINGVPICEKYVRKYAKKAGTNLGKGGRQKEELVPLFKEHISTDHFMRMSNMYKTGDQVTISVKTHGTSVRAGLLPVAQTKKWWQKLFGIEPKVKYGFVVGSRRVLKTIDEVDEKKAGSFFADDIWTIATRGLKDKLQKGEVIYAEIVGYTPSAQAIQPSHPTSKLKDFLDKVDYQAYVDNYGVNIDMKYGCEGNGHKLLVYRMSLTNEQGVSVDYSQERMELRCEQMGIETVPVIDRGFIVKGVDDRDKEFVGLNNRGQLEEVIDRLANATYCSHFPDTMREGVVIRVDRGGELPMLSKHKSLAHKYLEGILKDKKDYIDIEEQESEQQ